MQFYTAYLACCLLLLNACQQKQKEEAVGCPNPPTAVPTEYEALFLWEGMSSVQHFGHYERDRQHLILDSTTQRDYYIHIFDGCLDITKDDTLLAICNDAGRKFRPVTRMLGRTQPLYFVFEGLLPKEQLRIYECAMPNKSARLAQAPLRRVVVFELKRLLP
jgi:hypothetical protein